MFYEILTHILYDNDKAINSTTNLFSQLISFLDRQRKIGRDYKEHSAESIAQREKDLSTHFAFNPEP
jgi:hypothetical protein